MSQFSRVAIKSSSRFSMSAISRLVGLSAALVLIVICSSVHCTVSDEAGNDDSLILSNSRNFTVHSNETVQLPCVVRKVPSTIVVWNQCEDPNCLQLRNPLTINKDNFIDDLRFRILSENLQNSTENSENSNVAPAAAAAAEQQGESNRVNINSWTLEIRKFSKADEGCYQCQLNSLRVKTVHYCVKLQPKVVATPKKLTVHQNGQIKLKCYTDESVRMNQVKWYRNNHKLLEETHPGLMIDKKPVNDYITTTLLIKHATLNDAGVYQCKFGHIHEKIHVDVIASDHSDRIKSSEIRSNPDERSNLQGSQSPSLYLATAFSSAASTPALKLSSLLLAALSATLTTLLFLPSAL